MREFLAKNGCISVKGIKMHHYSEAVEEREDLPEKPVRHVLFAELMKRSGEMNMSLVRDYL